MATDPLISVVVPYHNEAPRIGAAIESIVDQRGVDTEVVLVDDGSTDASFTAAAEAATGLARPILLRLRENVGPSGARNAGLTHASGDLITFLDGDDLMTPGRLQTMLDELSARPHVDVILGLDELIVDTDQPLPTTLAHRSTGDRTPYPMSMLFRRALLETVGGFDTELRFGEDTDWLVRARAIGSTIHQIDLVCTLRRIHGENLTYEADRTTLVNAIARAHVRRSRAEGHYVPPTCPTHVDVIAPSASGGSGANPLAKPPIPPPDPSRQPPG